MLSLVLNYDALCREAITKGADVTKLFDIAARAKIGRAKSVPVDEYVEEYKTVETEMAEQINALTGGEEL